MNITELDQKIAFEKWRKDKLPALRERLASGMILTEDLFTDAFQDGMKAAGAETINSYYDGFLAGIWEYAYWADGTQYVGNGRLLREAEEEIESLRRKTLKAFQDGFDAAQVGNQSAQGANPVRTANLKATRSEFHKYCPLTETRDACMPQCAWWDAVAEQCCLLALAQVTRKAAAK